MRTIYVDGHEAGYEQAEKDLGWHSVDEFLPPINEEVIVLTDYVRGKFIKECQRICFAHITKKGIWNIPGVKFWMPMPEIPKAK